MNDLQQVPFQDLLEIPVRNGIYKKKEFHGSGTKIINMGELFAYPRVKDVQMKRLELTESEKERFLLKKGDLIFARRSLTAEGAGKCSIIHTLTEETTFESSIIRARPDKEKVSSEFLYYYFNSPYGKYLLRTIRRQVAVAGITGSDLMDLLLTVPLLGIQKEISAVLSSLDDKIDLLHRQNETLEALAQTLFRQWFVEEAEDDWEEAKLGDVLTTKGGTTPSTKNPDFWGGDIYWTTPRDLSNNDSPFLLDTARKITPAGLDKISSGLLPKGTLLLSSRAPVGYLGFADIPLAINQGYIGIIDNKGVSKHFFYLWLRENMDYVKSFANGSTFLEISKTAFKTLEIVIPPSDIRNKFEEITLPLFKKIRKNVYQIRTLERLRDTLLPKLMSGEVWVV